MFKFLKITCEEANHICNKSQYGEATFIEKLKLSWHLMICKFCSLYSKQNTTITKVCKNKAATEKAKEFSLTNCEKELLKEKIKEINS